MKFFTAGLLHDIGKLILASYFTDDFVNCAKYAEENDVPLAIAEMEVLGTTHMQIGAVPGDGVGTIRHVPGSPAIPSCALPCLKNIRWK